LDIGHEISYLGEVGNLTKDGWVQYNNQRHANLVNFCLEVRKVLQLGKDSTINGETVWQNVFLTEKNSDVSLAEIRSGFMGMYTSQDKKQKHKKKPSPKAKLTFNESSLVDDSFQDEDFKGSEPEASSKEELKSNQRQNKIEKVRYAPVVKIGKKKLKEKTVSDDKKTSSGKKKKTNATKTDSGKKKKVNNKRKSDALEDQPSKKPKKSKKN